MRKIIHVQFKEPVDGKINYYFGSKVAVFKRFTSEQIGITYKYLTTINLSNGPYVGKRCTIDEGALLTTNSADE